MNPDLPDQAADAAPIPPSLEFLTDQGRPTKYEVRFRGHTLDVRRLHHFNDYIDTDLATPLLEALVMLTEPDDPSDALRPERAIDWLREQLECIAHVVYRDHFRHMAECEKRSREAAYAAKQAEKEARPAPVKAKDRYDIFQRDGNRCLKCGAEDRLVIDHIIPTSCGGTSDRDNLQTLCRPCNSGKNNRTIDYRAASREGAHDAK